MTDVRFRDENQVIDFAAAARAAKDPTVTSKLTPELFEAAGVSVDERPPSNPTRTSDLVPDLVTFNAEALRQGTEAMARLSSNRSRDWADWCMVLTALGIGRHVAMLESGSNKPRGYKYCTAFAKWLRCHEAFQAIDQVNRKRMFDCLDNLSAIEAWRAGLPPAQLIKWNYPPTVLREWKKSQRPAPPNDGSSSAPQVPSIPLLDPIELRRQLELIGLARFRKEVMPEDWRTPLADTVLALATPDALIGALERKLSPSKNAGAALKSLRKSLRPIA
jgi:hypothetical protein